MELFQPSFSELVYQELEGYDFKTLQISTSHLQQVAEHPYHHRHPFDRLLIAQSQVEGIPIISSDAAFDHYAVERLW